MDQTRSPTYSQVYRSYHKILRLATASREGSRPAPTTPLVAMEKSGLATCGVLGGLPQSQNATFSHGDLASPRTIAR